jgi:nickel transport protein
MRTASNTAAFMHRASHHHVAVALFVLCLLLADSARSHDLQYTVTDGPAVVVKLFYPDNTPFTFEGYEIYRAGETLPYQVGRTDSQGRIAFLPDAAAEWRIKVISEDGHGLDFKLSTDAAATLIAYEKPLFERYSRIFLGVALILGVFGILNLFIKRKKHES